MKIKRISIARHKFDTNFSDDGIVERTEWDEDKSVKVLEENGIAVKDILGMCNQNSAIEIFYKSD